LFNIGPEEVLLILVIALLVFGPQRLPEIARSIGRGLREFRRVSDDARDQLLGGFDEPPVTAPDRTRHEPNGEATEAQAEADPVGEPRGGAGTSASDGAGV
jgi:sec-independent protein translocase protein TatA